MNGNCHVTMNGTVSDMEQPCTISPRRESTLWQLFDQEIAPTGRGDWRTSYQCSQVGDRESCDRCGSRLAFADEGFLTCTSDHCGRLYKDLVDHSAEWRYYGTDDHANVDPTRCGMPINPLLEESSYGCKVLCFGSTTYEMRKIRRYAEWQSMPYKEKSQYDEFQIITTMAHNAGIPKLIIDDAIRFHKRISEHDVTFRGDNRDGIIAASVYLSCRINNYPRTAKELATIFHLDTGSATRGCKNALLILNEIEKNSDEKTVFVATKPEAFLERYSSKLGIPGELSKLCHFVSHKVEASGYLAENTPPSIAAGIVYFVAHSCGLTTTKRDIKLISDISEVTINKCYKKLEMHRDELIPRMVLAKWKPNAA